MIWGSRHIDEIAFANVLVVMGQSNAVGRHENSRLANMDYNYHGISAGYPAVRDGQAQYTATPDGVYIYRKPGDRSANHSLDNGAWTAYQAGSNSSNSDSSGLLSFGSELSAAVRLRQATGAPVYVIKCAFGGTGLARTNTGSNVPGNWQTNIRGLAMNYWLSRGIRDLKTYAPGLRPRIMGICWWQGEEDGQMGIGKDEYKDEFLDMQQYMLRTINGLFVVDKPPVWVVTKLRYLQTAGEGVINDALTELAGENASIELVDCSPYPKGNELTTQQAAPMNTGTPNSDGSNDDNHMSYIGRLSVGELWAGRIIEHWV